jgi:uncharacterized protein (DUF433 family)
LGRPKNAALQPTCFEASLRVILPGSAFEGRFSPRIESNVSGASDERFSLAGRSKDHVAEFWAAVYISAMKTLTRITADPSKMGGRPCIRGIRVTVGTVVGLVASGHSRDEILRLYPYLEDEDISEALAYAAWRADEFEVPLSSK